MLFIIVCMLGLLSGTFGCDFSTSVEWACIPCGGPFTCTETGDTCFANAGDVPECTLIDGATSWMCCDPDICTVTGTGICDYKPPSPTSSSSGNNGGNGSHDNCASTCSWFQTCQCTCMFCDASNSGCFACETNTWFTVVIILIGVAFLAGVVITSVFVYLRKRSKYVQVNG